jgi:hypothetical protein
MGHQGLTKQKPSRTLDLHANEKYENGFVGELWVTIRAKQESVTS